MRTALVAVAVPGVFTALAVPGQGAWAVQDPVRTIATGFVGPLHIAAAPGGDVIVAEAFIGAIDRVDTGTGAVSQFISQHGFTPGVDVKGGQVFFTLSTEPHEGEPEARAALMRWTEDSGVTQVADLLAWEYAHNPDGQPQRTGEDADSNPYAVLALPGRTLVADAAGNDIIEVRSNGAMRTLARLPVSYEGECATATNNGVTNGGCDPVPTDLALGPDGFVYVSGLGAEVEGHIWKLNATTGAIVDHIGGFPPLTGITVADDGTVYAASLFTGEVYRLSHGTRTVADVPGPSDVDWARGTLYAATLDFEGPGSLVSIAPSAFHS
ncbi:MAG TPA: ScyD/ScyE family protein [Mycobacteriales bacterium]|nr:ScyD/ScyE family protein [Mycobacteriales bacterium]